MLVESQNYMVRAASPPGYTHSSVPGGVRCRCPEGGATTSLLETFIDETEKRAWFLVEATRLGNQPSD